MDDVHARVTCRSHLGAPHERPLAPCPCRARERTIVALRRRGRGDEGNPLKAERIFGTDGIRGRAGEGWLSVPAVTALGCALGDVLVPHGERRKKHRVLLGHDGRRSGPELEAALARGLTTHGFEVTSCGLITTPGLALLTKLERFQIGAMISASHNPAEDNGIKVFSGEGDKLSDAVELAIEERLHAAPAANEAGAAPAAER
jgi:phosphoglucosamine mutase